MIGRVFLSLGFVSAATAFADAQEIAAVRAGEHATYSRIAVPVSQDAIWEFTTFGKQANLRIPELDTTFDVSNVFDRIPKTRVLNIETNVDGSDTEIQLTLACTCPAKATVSGGYILIDVYDVDTNMSSLEIEEDRASSPQEVTSADRLSKAATPNRRPKTQKTEEQRAPDPDPEPITDAEMVETTPQNPNEREEATASSTVAPDADDVAELLIQQLRRAADQGLVELEPEAEIAKEPKTTTPQPTKPEPTTSLEPYEENADGMEALADRLQRALEESSGTSLNDAIRLQLPEERPGSPMPPVRLPESVERVDGGRPEHCLDDYYYDFSVLEPGKKPIEQIIDLRSRLLGEFDDPDATAALELTRLYIALGMGVEARALTAEFVSNEKQRAVLDELAQVVEGLEIPPGSSLDGAAGCPGPAAIWRTAGISKTEAQPVPEPQMIVEALADLPVELRRRLVPRVVASFITRNQINEAEASFAILDRAPGNHGPDHEFQRAALLKIGGQPAEAEAIFLRLSKRTDPSGPRALVALVESMVERDVRVPAALIEDTAAMARQFRDDAIGPSLRHAEILARAGNGRFGEALSVVSKEIRENPEIASEYLTVANDLFSQTRSETVGAGRYAAAIFDNLEMLKRDEVSQNARLVVAEEMIALGLPDAALSLVADGASGAADPKAAGKREALARAHLARDDPESALALLAGEVSNSEAQIRIDALTKLGRHKAALAEANLLETANNIAALGFRAGDWDLAAEDSNLNGALARYMIRIEDPAVEDADMDVATDPDLRALEMPTSAIDEITLEQADTVRRQSQSIRRVLSAELDGTG